MSGYFPLADFITPPGLLPPLAILVLCVAGGIGTLLLLPSRRQQSAPRIGGAILAAAAIIISLGLARAGAGRSLEGAGLFFWIFAAIAIFGAVRVITHPRPVYSALYFVLTVFASAGLFILMYAEFMAAALVLIYAGAILITYVFVIMLAASAQAPGSTRPMAGLADCDLNSREPFSASCIGFALMGALLFVIFDKAIPTAAGSAPTTISTQNIAQAPPQAIHGTTQSIGQYLFENQLVNLELAGVILTVSMVGAIVIARRRVADINAAFEPSAEVVTANMTPVNDDPRSIPVYGTTNPAQKAYPET